MGDVLVSTDGSGRWWRRRWASQCTEEVFLHGQCQGVADHMSYHWCFERDGSYCWQQNDDDPSTIDPDAVAGTCPPGNDHWVSPVDMADKFYMRSSTVEEIVDPTEIAFYESGGTRDDEGVTRPCTEDEVAEMINDGTLSPTMLARLEEDQ